MTNKRNETREERDARISAAMERVHDATFRVLAEAEPRANPIIDYLESMTPEEEAELRSAFKADRDEGTPDPPLRGELTVKLAHDETGALCATCVELPAAISGGQSIREALANIGEAIELCIDSGDVVAKPERPKSRKRPFGSYGMHTVYLERDKNCVFTAKWIGNKAKAPKGKSPREVLMKIADQIEEQLDCYSLEDPEDWSQENGDG